EETVNWIDDPKRSARLVAAPAALQIADVSFGIGVLPQSDGAASADLVDCLQIGDFEDIPRDELIVHNRIIKKSLASEKPDPAIFEDVVEGKRCLPEIATILVLMNVDMLKAAEQSRLEPLVALN